MDNVGGVVDDLADRFEKHARTADAMRYRSRKEERWAYHDGSRT
jgi:hypothetical protein